MNMDMNLCMNTEIRAQLASGHILCCCLTHSWFKSALRSTKSETHTNSKDLWRRFESGKRGRKKMHQLWMWSNTAPLLAVWAFKIVMFQDPSTTEELKNVEERKASQAFSKTTSKTTHGSRWGSDGKAAEKASVRARFMAHLRRASHMGPICISGLMAWPRHGPMGMDGFALDSMSVGASSRCSVLEPLCVTCVFFHLLSVLIFRPHMLRFLSNAKSLDVLDVGRIQDLSRRTW